MRTIDYIVIHCTATRPNTRVESIQKFWKEVRGWKSPGYHKIIDQYGIVTTLAEDSKICNGVRGYNNHSVHISYIGGVDTSGNPKDTRTEAQKDSMAQLIYCYHELYPDAIIQGHRDFPNVHKACPSFEVSEFVDEINLC